jgi:hypothetical protein
MTRHAQPCPYCQGTTLWYERACRGCGRAITISRAYVIVAQFSAIVIVSVPGYALGIRGSRLFLFVCFLHFPAFIVVFNITGRLFPPEHQVWDDYRLVLYGEKGKGSGADEETPDS